MSHQPRSNGATQLFAGLCICTTGLPLHVKEQIRKIVLACGGAFEDDLTLVATTHLVADAVGSSKQLVAAAKELPVVTSRWIFDSFRAHELLDASRYFLRVLEGIVIATTGLSEATRAQVEKLAAIHGATYEIRLEVGRTDALIAQAPVGPKYEAAVSHDIAVVHISWLHACIEKRTLVDVQAYLLGSLLQPRRLYKQLRQELDDLSSFKLRQLLQRYWLKTRQRDGGGDAETSEEPEEFMELFDACGFYLLGFPPEMEKSVRSLIRMGMGTIYYSMQLPAVSHVIVSPVLRDLTELERLEQQVVVANAEPLVHFVSAKWVVDSIKCLRLEPEEMYPVEVEEPELEARAAPPQAQEAEAAAVETTVVNDKRASIASVMSAEGDQNHDMQGGEDAAPDREDGALEPSPGPSLPLAKFLKEYGFLLVCVDPNEPKVVETTVRELQTQGGAQVVALDCRDFEHVDPAQFDFVTHIVVCSGVSIDPELAEIQRHKFNTFYLENCSAGASKRKKRLRYVSDLWVRCCLASEHALSHQSHELFTLTYHQPRSMFPIALPLPCFASVVVSTSVYLGVDRTVVMELLRMAGATVTSKMSKQNTHLICLNAFGMKYEKAKAWGLVIVTARWVVQSVLHGRLLDSTLPEFQVARDEDVAMDDATTSGSGALHT